MRSLIAFLALAVSSLAADAFLPGAKRIVFLGDSITYGGDYVDFFTAYVAARYPEREFEVFALGLPSETVSGLSEEGHAGGKFPRPTLHERLDRTLAKLKPDLIFACYGMNDGIYQPFDEGRFAKFRDGIAALRAKTEKAGAKVIHLTPPTFDPVPLGDRVSDENAGRFDKPFRNYNSVLDRYSEWLVQQRAGGWQVVDVHRVMNEILAARRSADPGFRFANDGVHCNTAGHWVIAMELIGHLEGSHRGEAMKWLNRMRRPRFEPAYMSLIRERRKLLSDAWLSEIGHERPGMTKGRPLEEATARAAELEIQIRASAPRIRTFIEAGQPEPEI